MNIQGPKLSSPETEKLILEFNKPVNIDLESILRLGIHINLLYSISRASSMSELRINLLQLLKKIEQRLIELNLSKETKKGLIPLISTLQKEKANDITAAVLQVVEERQTVWQDRIQIDLRNTPALEL